MFYFAYGTLLDLATMHSTAPGARSHGVMRLDGYRLGFARCRRGNTGGCTLIADGDAVTYGVQYELSEEEMADMDEMAICGEDLWVRQPVVIADADGNDMPSMTYTIPGDRPALAPTDEYVRPILAGLDDLDLSPEYVATVSRIITEAQLNR